MERYFLWCDLCQPLFLFVGQSEGFYPKRTQFQGIGNHIIKTKAQVAFRARREDRNLVKQMSMSSGYFSSAIRERIYLDDKMSGILLYTGSSDKEGSLGGLVELGNIDQMTNLMRDAFQEALVCTNDPECMSNLPAGKNSTGAACHSCCMISETACENGNRMLDRGLVVPIPEREECSYFKELVSELCQVEI